MAADTAAADWTFHNCVAGPATTARRKRAGWCRNRREYFGDLGAQRWQRRGGWFAARFPECKQAERAIIATATGRGRARCRYWRRQKKRWWWWYGKFQPLMMLRFFCFCIIFWYRRRYVDRWAKVILVIVVIRHGKRRVSSGCNSSGSSSEKVDNRAHICDSRGLSEQGLQKPVEFL